MGRVNAPLVDQGSIARPHLVFLVHGIRTLMSWRRALRKELAEIPGIDTQTFYYGFFSIFRFYLPWTREHVVRKFALEYFEQVATRNPARVSIIAHSFGTYVVCRALQKYPLEVDTLILCGSVLPEQEKFTSWFLHGKERVRQVVNDIAAKDVCVLLGKLVIPLIGAAGLVGLNMPGSRLTERVFPGYRHSSFFNAAHYRAYWVPIVRGEIPTGSISNGEIPSFYRLLIAWATPIKVFVNLCLVLLVIVGAESTLKWGNHQYTVWTARPFSVVGPVASDQLPSGCGEAKHSIKRAGKLLLIAPAGRGEERFQIRILIRLRSGSRWSIEDVESGGGGRVQMEVPNQEYWVYEVRPKERIVFVVCGVTCVFRSS